MKMKPCFIFPHKYLDVMCWMMAMGSILLFISFLLGNYYDNLVHPGESEEILHIFEARIHSFYQIEVQVKDGY